jgi:hypothetical protein
MYDGRSGAVYCGPWWGGPWPPVAAHDPSIYEQYLDARAHDLRWRRVGVL